MAATPQEILRRIASKDFIERLCVVSIDDEWWPSLKFGDYKDFINTLNLDFDRISTRLIKAKAAMTWRSKADGENPGLVYLLGRDSFMLHPESGPEIVHDFYDYYEEMEVGSKQLKEVRDMALDRVSGVGLAEKKDNGGKVECLEVAPALACAAVKPEPAKSSEVISVHESGYVPNTAKKAQRSSGIDSDGGDKKARGGEKKKKGTPSKKGNIGAEETKKGQSPSKEERKGFPVDEVMESAEKEAVSPLRFSDDGESVSIENATKAEDTRVVDNRISRHVPLADKSVSWHVFFQSMKDGGWTYRTGTGLIAFYWVHPTCKHLKLSELRARYVQNQDYFESEEAVKRYAKKVYGWEGEVESPMSTNPGLDIGDQVKQGRRMRKAAANSGLALASAKRSPRDAASKKRSSRSAASQSSNADGSRFSLGGNNGEKSGFIGKKLNYDGKQGDSASRDTRSTAPCSDVSSAASVESSIDETYQVMKSGEAWKLLMNLFGFSYTGGKYCLPGKENKPSVSSAHEGINFFSSIEELRKHLCAYGLPVSKKALSDEEKVDISRWVRYAHISSIADGAFINEDYIGEPIKQSKAFAWLQQLGLKYTSGYVIPKSSSHAYKKFERAEEFYKYLARFGIPHYDNAPGPALSTAQRLKLDLFIYNPGKHLDTFERINPQSNEVTPRRTRQSSNHAPDPSPGDEFVSRAKEVSMSKKKKSKFTNDFELLESQRDLPVGLVGSEKVSKLLQEHYGISHLANPDGSFYCFTDPHSNEEIKFNNLQDLRENLCAYGLPCDASNIDKEDQSGLESWIRCAYMKGLGEPAKIPTYLGMDSRKAKTLIKALGYKISKDLSMYVLPGADFHNPTIGENGWDSLIGFINHIARFGPANHGGIEEKSPLSSEDLLQFQIYIVITSTHDISKRIKCDVPLEQPEPMKRNIQSSFEVIESTVSGDFPYGNDDGLLTQPATMIEEHDSPQPPAPKNCQPKQTGILGFFKKAAARARDSLLSPNKSSKQHPSGDNDQKSYSSQGSERSPLSLPISASCLEKGDEDLEACFSGSSSKYSTAKGVEEVREREDVADKANEDEGTHAVAKKSPSKRKAEDVTSGEISPKVAKLPKVSSNERFHRKTGALNSASYPKMSWRDMRLQLFNDGLSYLPGSGFESYWYIQPYLQGIKKTQLSQFQEGEDYFTSEESLALYAKSNLGWDGVFEVGCGEGRKRSPSDSITIKSPPKRGTLKGEGSPPKKARMSPKAKSNKNAPPPKNAAKNHDSFDDVSVCLPDIQSITRDKLSAAVMALHTSFVSYCAVSSKTSQIMEFMEESVVTGRSRFLYVCGRPGTGKTTVVSQCSDDIQSWSKKEGHDVPRIGLVNIASLSASASEKYGIQKAMLKHVAKKLGIEKDPSIDALQKTARKNAIILVIDEVDMLIQKKDSDGERFFRELVKLANSEQLNFSMIGLSNSVNDESSARIREIANPKEVVFTSYDEKSLVEIITRRIGERTVDSKALELVSRKIAATTGDARKALEIVSSACQRCIDSLSEEELSKKLGKDDSPPVKIKHMMWAIREGNLVKHAEVIRRLPPMAKVLLCIAVAYSHKMGPNAEISLATLKKLCQKATEFALFDDSDVGIVGSLCEMLHDAGLLRAANTSDFDSHDSNAKLILGTQMDDVECALEESLVNGVNGAFYSKLLDFDESRRRQR